MSEKIRFTGHTYKCPKCGRAIDGYWDSFWKTPNGKIYGDTKQPDRPDEETDEDNDEFYWAEVAGCVNCLDFWFIKDLEDISEVKVQFD